MKKLIHRIRDWLIKKLGGYTKKEYETINRIPFQNIAVEERGIEHLRAVVKIDRKQTSAVSSSSFLKHELARQLLPMVMDYMKIKRIRSNYISPDTVVFEATIDVVRGN